MHLPRLVFRYNWKSYQFNEKFTENGTHQLDFWSYSTCGEQFFEKWYEQVLLNSHLKWFCSDFLNFIFICKHYFAFLICSFINHINHKFVLLYTIFFWRNILSKMFHILSGSILLPPLNSQIPSKYSKIFWMLPKVTIPRALIWELKKQ